MRKPARVVFLSYFLVCGNAHGLMFINAYKYNQNKEQTSNKQKKPFYFVLYCGTAKKRDRS